MNTYVFDSSTKKNIFITLGIGVLMLILGVLFFDSGSHEKEASHSATHTAVTTDKHTTADEHTATADH